MIKLFKIIIYAYSLVILTACQGFEKEKQEKEQYYKSVINKSFKDNPLSISCESSLCIGWAATKNRIELYPLKEEGEDALKSLELVGLLKQIGKKNALLMDSLIAVSSIAN